MWGGIECTVNRVDNNYFDQLKKSGHDTRIEDIDFFAELGITKIRYPFLWERIAPEGIDKADWTWVDERLQKLKAKNIEPIVGFVHHGSGPQHTCLIKPCFIEGLKEYAEAFIKRYPWLNYFTPINEPLTTARFSGLYGIWYPHGRGEKTFARALVTQCMAITVTMGVIRQVNPAAKLVQTEDLGKTYSTPLLAYQANFENERRWMSIDLISGKINYQHPLWKYLLAIGVTKEELNWFLENPCPPDILGINHYVTSERFLDENIKNYPKSSHGGNGIHRYADIEAVRVKEDGINSHYTLLKETWERYNLPIAVTEVHLHCTREEQLRWLKQSWDASVMLRKEGVDICAITAWALLGSFNWANLVTKDINLYETGIFDIRNGKPRPTALARMVAGFALQKEFFHPVADLPGWWKRPGRLLYPAKPDSNYNVNEDIVSKRRNSTPLILLSHVSSSELKEKSKTVKPLLIIGASGTLATAFAKICEERLIPCVSLSRYDLDLLNFNSIIEAVEKYQPWAIVNAAGYVKVEEAEQERESCWQLNTYTPILLATACRDFNIPFLTYSSDLVFEGKKNSPYLEKDEVGPLNHYGVTKALAEKEVLKIYPNSLVIRTSSFFGPWDKYNWVYTALNKIMNEESCFICDRQIFTPTYVPDLVNTSLDLLIDNEQDIWHLSNKGAVTWAQLVRKAAEMLNLDTSLIQSGEVKSQAKKPLYSALGTTKGVVLPTYDESLFNFCNQLQMSVLK